MKANRRNLLIGSLGLLVPSVAFASQPEMDPIENYLRQMLRIQHLRVDSQRIERSDCVKAAHRYWDTVVKEKYPDLDVFLCYVYRRFTTSDLKSSARLRRYAVGVQLVNTNRDPVNNRWLKPTFVHTHLGELISPSVYPITERTRIIPI